MDRPSVPGVESPGTRRPGFEGTRGHSNRADPSRNRAHRAPGPLRDMTAGIGPTQSLPLWTQAHPRHGSGTLGRVDPGKVPQGAVSGRLMSFPLRKGSPIMRSECPHAGSLFSGTPLANAMRRLVSGFHSIHQQLRTDREAGCHSTRRPSRSTRTLPADVLVRHAYEKKSTTQHRARSTAGTRRIGDRSATHQTANLCGKLNCASLPRPQDRAGHSTSGMIQEDMKILEPRRAQRGRAATQGVARHCFSE